ncbi:MULTISPECIES: ATP-dependent Clp protease ATP-binding subunit ClpA [Halobacteriovorax]|uniref:ATP-dependent Clp protease ATP-binding subunit ClpA n=1 Tax=Halobacteriovorax vibrionivorans TaxID=2152716 RepID=A0ABY0IIL1_9BACT|nr:MULTISPECIES: ATP-dependent Clp protease ATP-binding subunit ClpA [Halobacteriovorax]AYF45369.1 ATP-dependent Clp protease ATP-binding subunit ClpA [Halobacteriovorax sp. BALOs_7]RZF22452.1 ATP-dependent Clp protease ATP-binding subunit ClpA [Halobacteriovorax vibrionivorans]TGD47643.1 ATP-dependent Clp protease ATP-binding subunit ClpA [Halobacteriovorax sp. Y22]
MMSKKLETIINESIQRANTLRHEYLTLENVLLSLLSDENVREIIEYCGGNLDEMESELNEFIHDESNFSILTEDQIDSLSKQQFVNDELRELARENGITYQPEISMSLQRVIQRAAIHVQSSGKSQILGVNLLVSLFQEKESFALYSLQKQGIERFDVVKAISHGLSSDDEEGGEEIPRIEYVEGEDVSSRSKKGDSFLAKFTINLNEQARENRIDPLVGREEEALRIVQILCRRRKNNPLLVGEAGVGKTAIVEGLAQRIVEEDVPEVLKGTTIFNLDMAALVAGAKFRGDFEQRVKGVIKDLEKLDKDGKKAILFIDEMHTVMGAGATSGGSMDASNLLKPALSRGVVRVIGSTTYAEHRKFIEKDPAFNRRFQKIDIDEPSNEDTIAILKGLKPKFETYHGVKISDNVIKEAVALTSRYLMDRKNPDKSIDAIDEAGALNQIRPEKKKKSSITKKDIEDVVAKMANIPKLTVETTEKDKLKDLNKNLKMLIFGQDHAVDEVSQAIYMAKSGLGDEGKPISSFLFAGPTGVGKTELAKQLANQLGCHLERFDMSEYMEKHSVSKLIGSPPGYVGHDQGGLLTDAVKKNPHSVLLLDEIEKAHVDIYNILLQVMDHGSLTDSQGRTTDFTNTVIIMTTNAGAKEMDSGAIGLAKTSAKNTGKRDQTIKNFFSPEFRNRLDGIVHFDKLSTEYIVKIVEKFVSQLEMKLAAKNIEIVLTEKAKIWLAENGFDEKMGARPIARIIDQKLKKPISTEVLFGKLTQGGKIEVTVEDDELKLLF